MLGGSEVCVGDEQENCEWMFDTNDGAGTKVRPHFHFGADSRESVWQNGNAWETVVAASGTQAAFDAACVALWPGFWSNLPQPTPERPVNVRGVYRAGARFIARLT